MEFVPEHFKRVYTGTSFFDMHWELVPTDDTGVGLLAEANKSDWSASGGSNEALVPVDLPGYWKKVGPASTAETFKDMAVAGINTVMILVPGMNSVAEGFTAIAGPMAGSSEAAAIAECDGISTFCFPAGTPVATSTGAVLIEAIRIGNEVWAYDLIASQWRTCRVLQTFVHDHEGTSAFITVEGETIESTFGHPFWVVRGDDLANRRCPEHIVVPDAQRPPAGGLRRVTSGSATSCCSAMAASSRFRPSGMSRSGGRCIISRSPSLKATRLGIIMYSFTIRLATVSGWENSMTCRCSPAWIDTTFHKLLLANAAR